MVWWKQDKRVWLIRLQEAASDLATSDLEEAATANDRRRAGVESARARQLQSSWPR
jgi:hypothetical protein